MIIQFPTCKYSDFVKINFFNSRLRLLVAGGAMQAATSARADAQHSAAS
jgi:hypothetical protein